MGFLFEMEELGKKDQEILVRRTRQCKLCPYGVNKPADNFPASTEVLVITDNLPINIDRRLTGYSTYHTERIECHDKIPAPTAPEVECCLGRKTMMIDLLKPKVVIVAGHKNLNDLDDALGLGRIGFGIMGYPMPTTYKGHSFWLIMCETEGVSRHIESLRSTISFCMQTPPPVRVQDDSKIEFVTESKFIEPAFTELLKNPYNAYDLETKRDRPYYMDSRILTIGIGTADRTFVFPIHHSMTPSKFRPFDVLNRLEELFTKTRIIAHNGPYDWEWLVHKFGFKFAYTGIMEDTMAQIFVLKRGKESKSLDAALRREFGMRIKSMNWTDVKDLDFYPLGDVMLYNGRDTQNTEPLFHALNARIQREGLEKIYRKQVSRIPAIVCMQVKGLICNHDFVQSETAKRKAAITNALDTLRAQPPVKNFETALGRLINPASDKDIATLYHDFVGMDKAQTKFDEKTLLKIAPGAVTDALLDFRGHNKMYTTVLAPLNPKDSHHNAGNALFPDGKLHTTFNTMLVVTARLSSEGPNVQNMPKRGGQEYMRDIIIVPDGYWFVSADQGQIEYKMIAALSKDKEMIYGLLNGLDVHAWWAQWLIDNLAQFGYWDIPCKSIPCSKDLHEDHTCDPICYKCWFKEFRSRAKNGLVFPFCFGAGYKKVGGLMGVKDEHHQRLTENAFWDRHKGVKAWHQDLEHQMRTRGYVENAFGRRFYGPLKYNQMVNYPIQSTMADLVNDSMCRICEDAVRTEKFDRIPILNVHDDLSYCLPETTINEDLEHVIPIMLDTRDYDWLPVPLTLEVGIGKTWGNTKKLGEFNSKDLYGIPGAAA